MIPRLLVISIHALREEGDQPTSCQKTKLSIFLSTPSARRATRFSRHRPHRSRISIHALREEGDGPPPSAPARTRHFYPRPPRGGRPPLAHGAEPDPTISIHALREEGDVSDVLELRTAQLFLSTPSARRATFHFAPDARPPKNFYPRPPRGGRPGQRTRASLERRFLSTPSARRATILWDNFKRFMGISIHALREEGDGNDVHKSITNGDFYPRPPRGGRL